MAERLRNGPEQTAMIETPRHHFSVEHQRMQAIMEEGKETVPLTKFLPTLSLMRMGCSRTKSWGIPFSFLR
jgi:hypothetical protein